MYPTLITVGPVTITSFGLLLVLSFVIGLFSCWRLVNIYELNKEKIIDSFLIIILGSIVGSRLAFVAEHWQQFDTFLKIILINKYPGMSWWGGFILSVILVSIFIYRSKLNWWQIADLVVVGLFSGLAVGSFGCLLGACQAGQVTAWPIGIDQAGLVGKRFPLQIVEMIIYWIIFQRLWKASIRFHFLGQVAVIGLVWLSVIKFGVDFFRAERSVLYLGLTASQLLSIVILIIALVSYYRLSKRSLSRQVNNVGQLFYRQQSQKQFITQTRRQWYNLRVKIVYDLTHLPQIIAKKINVKPFPKKFH